MIASGPIMMADGTATLLLSGARCPEGTRMSDITPARLSFATCSTAPLSTSNGLAPPPKLSGQAQSHRQRRFPITGWTTTVHHSNGLKVGGRPMVAFMGLRGEGSSLSRNEVVGLLSVAVQTLLKPENQQRLQMLLEKSKQQGQKTLAVGVEQPSILNEWNSTASIMSLQDLEGARHSETQSDFTGITEHHEKSPLMRKIVDFSNSNQMIDRLEPEPQFRSTEARESSAGSVQSKEEKSLTTIRRLKVLNVHSYVHNALRQSAMRSWLQSRTMEGL